MKSDELKQKEDELKDISEFWSKVHPGRRLTGQDREGNYIVVLCDDPTTILGTFSSEEEAEAYAKSQDHIDMLAKAIRKLVKDHQAVLQVVKGIAEEIDPAFALLELNEETDLEEPVRKAHRWAHYLLNQH